MGILEKIYDEQLKTNKLLEELCRAMGKTLMATPEQTAPVVKEQVITTETLVTDAASAPEVVTGNTALELDADGVPWDERIHSSNKKQTGKGVWQKKKGVDKDEHARITVELKLANAPVDDNIVTTETPAPAGGIPAAPAPTAGIPAAPAPTAGSVPPAPAGETGFKAQAQEAIDKILDNNKLDFAVMSDYYLSQHNTATFTGLQHLQWETCVRNMERWQQYLDRIKVAVDGINAIYASDPSVIQPHITAVFNKAHLNDVPCSDVTTVPFTFAEQVADDLEALFTQCQSLGK